jgi:hypothetical protein
MHVVSVSLSVFFFFFFGLKRKRIKKPRIDCMVGLISHRMSASGPK